MDSDQNQDIQNSHSRPYPPTEQKAETLVVGEPSLPFDFHKLQHEILEYKITELEKEKKGQEIFPVEFLESEKLTLKQPITVRASYSTETATWVVDHFELNIYGEGRDEDEAVKDFKIALEETYFNLKEDKDKLGPFLQKQWNLFEKIIREK